MKFQLNLNLKNAIIHNFWLKIISLVMAIITWLYASGELASGIGI
jgi:hypothetical protein